jgi:hypothetical protein
MLLNQQSDVPTWMRDAASTCRYDEHKMRYICGFLDGEETDSDEEIKQLSSRFGKAIASACVEQPDSDID